MSKTSSKDKGFTLLELLMVIGVATILMGFVTINLVKVQHNTSVSAVTDTLIADLKNQQIKAMTGASTAGSADNYGVFFSSSNKYTLFHGLTYNPADSTNYTVTLDDNSQVSSTFQSNVVIFTHISGEVLNFSNAQNTITVKNTSGGEQQTLTINKLGVITSVN